MPHDTHQHAAALAYARSVIELAEERGAVDAVGDELAAIGKVLAEHPEIGEFLANPAVGRNDQAAMLANAFDGRASGLVSSVLGVMARKGRLALLPAVITQYQKLLNEKKGNVDVDLTVAHALSADQLEHARSAISLALGKNAIVRPKVDESILGGVVVRVGDRLLDASVRSQLETLRQKLLAAAPR